MKLQDLVEKQYGVKTDIRINPLVSQVQITATNILKPNPNRIAWTLINLGANPMYVSFTNEVSTTNGVYVSASGGVLGLVWNEDFALTTYPVWALATVAIANVYLVEVIAR